MNTPFWDHERLYPLAQQLGWTLHATRDIASTNTALIRQINDHPIHRHCFITDEQNQGRGRQGKVWHAKPGHAFIASFGWTLPQSLHGTARGASLVAGLCVTRALTPFTTEARLKWPNDILLHNKKLAGILIEVAQHTPQHTTLVIGIGLNWLSSPATESLHAIGLSAACPQLTEMDRYAFLNSLLNQIDSDFFLFGEDGFAPFRYDWMNKHAWAVGTPVCWQDAGRVHEGVLDTLDEYGNLWIVQNNGQRTPLGEHAYTLRPQKELL